MLSEISTATAISKRESGSLSKSPSRTKLERSILFLRSSIQFFVHVGSIKAKRTGRGRGKRGCIIVVLVGGVCLFCRFGRLGA